MTDFIILLIIATAVVFVIRYRAKREADGSSCCLGCASAENGCSSCRAGGGLADRMESAPVPEKKVDYSEKKIVFFDIDGTIVDGPTHQIPESTVRAVRRLQENGHLAFINTGRTLVSIERRIRDIGFDGFVCGCGTHIYYEGKVLYACSIPHEKCVEIIKKLREFKIPAFFEAPDTVYYDSRCASPELSQSVSNFQSVGSNVKDFPEDLENGQFTFDKFFCLFKEDSDVEGLEEYIRDDFTGTPQGTGHLEVVPKGRSKAEGIRFLQETFGIRLDNCYAIGDSENDIPMLEAVPNSIAMGTCSPLILPHCSYHTDKVMEDGIEKALVHYGLI